MTNRPDFTALFAASPYPYLLIDTSFVIIGANPAYLRATGRTSDDIVGKHIFDAFPSNPADPDSTNINEVRASIEIAITTQQPHTSALLRYAIPRETADGTVFDERYWSAVHTPVFDETGKVSFVSQNAIDVTDLYRFDESTKKYYLKQDANAVPDVPQMSPTQMHEAMTRILNAERSQLRILFDQAPGFIAVLTGKEHVFEIVNEAYYQLVGHRNIIGKPAMEALPELDGQGFKELLDKAFDSGEPVVLRERKITLRRNADTPPEDLYVDLLYQPIIGEDGRVTGIFAQGNDVTRVYQASRALAEKVQQLEEIRSRQAFKLELTDRIRSFSNPDDVTAAACELLGRKLDVSRVLYADVKDDCSTIYIHHDWTAEGIASLAGHTEALVDFGPETLTALRSGAAVIHDDVEQDSRTAEHTRAYERIGVRADLLLPLIKAGRLQVVLTIQSREPRVWRSDDIKLAQEIAERTWSAVEAARAQAALRAERDQSQYIFDSMDEGFAVLDCHWTILRMNAEGLRITQRSADDVIGHNHWNVFPELKDTSTELIYRRVMETGVSAIIEIPFIWPDKSHAWIEIRAYPSLDGGIAFFFRDVTERRKAQEQLREQTDKLQIATEAAGMGLFDHNLATAEVSWSERTREHFGVPTDIPLSREFVIERFHPDDRERMRQTLETIFATGGDGRYQAEYRTIGLDGHERWIAARGKVLFDAHGRPARTIGTTMDISDRKRTEKQIQEAAQHDSLTGLPNRALLAEYCSHILAMSERSGEPGAVLFIDLDRFKPINDLYGHDVGDKVLQEVAQRLLVCTRKEDIVSRLGGDEFIIVLPRILSSHDPATVAKHILRALDQPISVGSHQLTVSPSIGISLFPEHGLELELLIRCSDLAMYSAKKTGRNNFKTYSPGLNEHASDLLRLEVQLKQALESRGFALYYQPIIDIQSGKLVGAEALVRMIADDGGLLSPAVFIPVAEAAGLINDLGEWVVREACRQHQAWSEIGLNHLSIAINVSAIQFRQPTFSSMLADAIHDSGIDPAYLQIEVTESAVMDNIPETVSKLNQLRAMGIRISLDDFGTGYSSLSYLSSLPLDKLKIDQSFIREMGKSQRSRSITEAIIGLGQTLNLKVVGEGIESEESMEYLRDFGCDQAQGFLFSKPLPAHEFESWCRMH